MKKTISTIGLIALIAGMFIFVPSCKQKPADDTTVTTDSTTIVVTDTTTVAAPAAVKDSKDIKTPADPGK